MMLLLFLATFGQADSPQFDTNEPIGWATAGEGTTGGAGGPTVDVTSADELARLVKSSQPKILRLNGKIVLTSDVRVGSNTSLIGIGADAKLSGGGLHLSKVRNVLIRNLAIDNAGDAVSIEASDHVWIDHCDFSNCRDGLVDIKRGSDFITVSWNHFHDHHKTCLLGHSDKPDIQQMDEKHLRVTYHHNYFDGTQTRHPRVRFAEGVHVFNNYYRGNEYGVAAVMDAGVIVEGNYFEDVRQPTLTSYGDSPDPGRLVQRGNLFVRCGQPESRGEVDERQITYTHRLDDPSLLPALIRRSAGTGRLAAN
jgi:pectate lyase